MVSSRLAFFLSAIFIFTAQAVAQPAIFVYTTQSVAQPTYLYHFCPNLTVSGVSANSTYEANLNRLLSSLYTNAEIDYGFYNSSYGQNSDQAYAIGLCRGDINPDVCRGCLNNATSILRQHCPNKKEAIVWYDYCMLRYSNRSILGVKETSPSFYLWNVNNVSANYVNQFNDDLRNLLERLRSQAVAGDSLRKFATGDGTAPESKTLYGLVQCTPDLSEHDCNDCLRGAIEDIPRCCDGNQVGGVSGPSCNIRFEVSPFYNSTATASSRPSSPVSPPPPLTNTNTTKVKGGGKNTTKIVIITVSSTAVAAALLGFWYYSSFGRRKIKEAVDEITSVESLQFNFGTIRAAANNFSDANKIGKGGFGVVYRGRLSNGQEIAVKRLSKNSGQGDLEFKNEVLLVAKLQHRNLVKLLGFCLEGNERLLIYEFVPNTSLDHYIFDPMKRADLDWGRRYKIIGGIARGLLYLHEDSRLRIIHRDLKTGNILLDAKMNPKISDFGMARLFVLDQTEGSTNRIVGTYGYMAPEYAMFGQFSTKSDVFSFGILILEIISGRKITNFRDVENMEYLLSYAWRKWREGTTSNLIDPTLMKSGPITEMVRCIHIGLLCVQQNVADRPEMASIVLMLNSNSVALPVPTQPASFMQSNVQSASSLQVLDINCGGITNCEVSISELYPR